METLRNYIKKQGSIVSAVIKMIVASVVLRNITSQK